MKYIFDRKNLDLKKDRLTFGRFLKGLLLFFVSTLSFFLVAYVVFALVFSTPLENHLRRQNRMYREQIPQFEQKQKLLSEVIESLQYRDDEIYNAIFHTAAPDIDPTSSIEMIHDLDSIPDSDFVRYTKNCIDTSFAMAARIEENFKAVMEVLSNGCENLPPLTSPVRELTYAQVSASVGEKVNPFYKVPVTHNGLDIIVTPDIPVYCTADGVVSDVTRSRKGLGNTVTVTHAGGYRTVYAHLAQINAVKGRKMSRGSMIGTVGMSGNSFAPHLHYEVYRDTLAVDPVNYLFASVSPEDYVNMLIMSTSTKQSMD